MTGFVKDVSDVTKEVRVAVTVARGIHQHSEARYSLAEANQ